MSEVETLFRHVIVTLCSIAASDKWAHVYEADEITEDYLEMINEIEDMREEILAIVSEDGEESLTLEDIPPPVLNEAKQVFLKCLKIFIFNRYQ